MEVELAGSVDHKLKKKFNMSSFLYNASTCIIHIHVYTCSCTCTCTCT